MMCRGQKLGTSFWIKRAIFFPIVIAAGLLVFGWVVMQLWNCILPSVLGVSTITFWQALGIFVLSKILFGGFKGGNRRHEFHRDHKHDYFNRWMHMSNEEREKIKAEWKERFEPHTKQE